MKKIILALTTIFLLVACQSNEGKKAPSGQIIADGIKYELTYHQYKWIEGNLEIRQPLQSTIYEAINDYQAIPVKEGDELLLQTEKEPDSVSVNIYDENGKHHTSTLTDNKIIVPSEEDNYIYEVIAKWENGSTISYVFSVEYSE